MIDRAKFSVAQGPVGVLKGRGVVAVRREVRHWRLTTLREELIKSGDKEGPRLDG